MIHLAKEDIRHTLGKFIVTAMGVGMLLGLYVFVTETPYSRSVQVTDLEICDILYSTDGIPKSIKICGYIFNEEPETIVTLDIYLFHMPDKKSISFMSHQNDNDLFDEGFFSRDLSLNGTTGDYLLKVMLFRDIIGTLEFRIQE